jgi:hypothetical protein
MVHQRTLNSPSTSRPTIDFRDLRVPFGVPNGSVAIVLRCPWSLLNIAYLHPKTPGRTPNVVKPCETTQNAERTLVLFRNEGVTGSNPVSSTTRPGQGDIRVADFLPTVRGSAMNRVTPPARTTREIRRAHPRALRPAARVRLVHRALPTRRRRGDNDRWSGLRHRAW